MITAARQMIGQRLSLTMTFAVLTVLQTATAGLAANFELTSKIDAVTVFPKGAEITRYVEIAVPAGDHTLIVKDLPSDIRHNSIRVTGQVSGALEMSSVDSRTIYVEADDTGLDKDERKRLEKEIEQLSDQRRKLDNRIKTARTQKRFIEGLAARPPFISGQKPSELPPTSPLPMLKPQDLSQIFFLIGTSLDKAYETILKTEIERRALDKKLKALRAKLAEHPQRRKRRTEVKINISAKTPAEGKLRLVYQTRQAWWSPLYDARLETGSDTGKPVLTLLRRATISQRTGEPWENVTLALSTTRPGQGTAAPELHPQKVSFYVPPKPVAHPAAQRYRSSDMARRAAKPAAPELAAAPPAPVTPVMKAKPKTIRNRTAVAKVAAFQAVFAIPGRVTVPQTGDPKKVFISATQFTPALIVRAAPKRNPAAYLYAAFKLTGDLALLPGEVMLYRDGTFVGQGRMPLIHPGAQYELGFGVNDAIKITRREVKRSKGETGLLTTAKIDRRQFKISVTNRGKQTAKITIFDQIPYSEEETIEVTLASQTTPPTVRDYKDRRGILAWTFTLQPGKTKNIILAYDITWPRDKKIVIHRR